MVRYTCQKCGEVVHEHRGRVMPFLPHARRPRPGCAGCEMGKPHVPALCPVCKMGRALLVEVVAGGPRNKKPEWSYGQD